MSEKQHQEAPDKRYTCNRCHAQKLRCTRSDLPNAEKACLRCQRANTLCVYGPSERLGRPPDESKQKTRAAPGLPNRKRQRRGSDVDIDSVGVSQPYHDRSTSENLRRSKAIAKKTRKPANLQIEDKIDVHQICAPNSSSTLETRYLPADTPSHESEEGNPSQLRDGMLSNDSICDDFGLSALGSLNFDFSTSPLVSLAADDRTLFEDVSTQAAPTVRDVSIAYSGCSNHPSHAPMLPCASDPAALHNTDRHTASHTHNHQTAHFKTLEEFMRKLSDIIIRLFNQLEIISNSSIETLSTPLQPAKIAGICAASNDWKEGITPVGEVFYISQDLIQLLKSVEPALANNSTFTTVVNPYAGIASHSSVKSQRISHPYELPSPSSCSLMEFDTAKPAMALPPSPQYLAETGIDPSPSPDPPNILQLDIPIMLLVATCYNRLIRIYNALFSRYIRILKDYPNAAERFRLAEILPCVELGGFKPLKHGSLQISIMVETSLYMIGQIEDSLERWGRNRCGSSGTPEFGLQLMDLVMKEDGSGFLEDGGCARQLRENTETIKRLVKIGQTEKA